MSDISQNLVPISFSFSNFCQQFPLGNGGIISHIYCNHIVTLTGALAVIWATLNISSRSLKCPIGNNFLQNRLSDWFIAVMIVGGKGNSYLCHFHWEFGRPRLWISPTSLTHLYRGALKVMLITKVIYICGTSEFAGKVSSPEEGTHRQRARLVQDDQVFGEMDDVDGLWKDRGLVPAKNERFRDVRVESTVSEI